jgi:radical SAM protein with 4Fe4S-binding SPASM domain
MKYQDPGIPRKSALINKSISLYKDILLPSVVEVNESGICNRSCSFCPKSDPSYPNVKNFISDNLIDKLTSELGALDYKGIFVFSGFCEPLLDVNIYNLINIASRNMPNAKVEVVTNGDPLNLKNMIKLFESGLSTLIVSAYDGPEQLEHFNKMAMDAGIKKEKVFIRPRYLPEDQDFGITLNNRSGMMSEASYKIDTLTEPLIKRCNYPFYSFFMDYNGDVLLCSHDWGKKMIVGNVNKNSFIEIWDGEKFNYARNKLAKKDRHLKPCNLCDVNGTIMGNEHVKIWEKSGR